ncbi:MAG: M13 family peptidase, partial [Bacillota bacterium]
MKPLFTKLFITGLCLFSLSSFSFANNNPEEKKGKGFNLAGMDKSVDPGVDFYRYAVGTWLKENPVPAEYSRWGTMEVLRERNNNILKQILEKSAERNAAKGSIAQKLGTFYKVGMDSAKIEKDGFKPINPVLIKIGTINSKQGLYDMLAFFHQRIGTPFFNLFAEADAENSKMIIGWLYQGGLGLPDRDYYLHDDPSSKEIRARYLKYISRMFLHLGLSKTESDKNAETVMRLETELAKASMTRVELRDPVKTFNKMSVAKLSEIAQGFDWSYYFKTMGLENPGDINVAQPEFFKKIGHLVSTVPLDEWKIYLKWNLVRSSAGYLSSVFVNEKFEFENKFLNGVKQIQPRWKRVLATTNEMLGEALGQLYVKENFTPAAKQRALGIVKNLLSSMRERIQNVDWMSDATKAKAIKKLDAFGVKIGYP